jgi:hypothetical protein
MAAFFLGRKRQPAVEFRVGDVLRPTAVNLTQSLTPRLMELPASGYCLEQLMEGDAHECRLTR